jgi:hypothetical protein
MLIVGFIGPAAAERLGLSGWWGLLVPGVMVFVFLRWLGCPPAARQQESVLQD